MSIETPPLVDARVDAAGQIACRVTPPLAVMRDDLAAQIASTRTCPLVLRARTSAFFGART